MQYIKNREDAILALTDEEILKYVAWPKNPLTPRELRTILNTTRRFIDFDGTICAHPNQKNTTLRGVPLEKFLAEEPFIVGTWVPPNAIDFFVNQFPDLPKPILIIFVPFFWCSDENEKSRVGKNFEELGIRGAIIIDDLKPEAIRAPGCTILPPND